MTDDDKEKMHRELYELLEAHSTDNSVSDEMHKYPRAEIDPESGELKRILELSDALRMPFPKRLESIRAAMDAELQKSNLPALDRIVLVKDGDWRYAPGSFAKKSHAVTARYLRRTKESSTMGWSYVVENTTELSDDWFRAQIVKEIDIYFGISERKNAQAYKIGQLVSKFESRVHYSNVAVAKKIRRGASDGGKSRARDQRQRSQEILSEMKNLIDSGENIKAAATKVHEAGLGTSPEANRRRWYRR